MKQANSSFKLRTLLQKLISVILVFCLIFGLSAETIAFASETLLSAEITETVEHKPDTPAYPSTVIVEDEQSTPPRSLDELKTLAGVYVNEDGLVTRVNCSGADLTREELELLLTNGAGFSSSGGNPALRASGLTAAEFEFAAQLHGGENAFSRELATLNRSIEIDGLDETQFTTIKALICSGYTYRQARAAAVSAPILGVTTDELCRAKIAELANAESATIALDDENTEYHTAAIKMGVPYSIIEDYSELHPQTDTENIAAAFTSALQSTYTSSILSELQSGNMEEPGTEVTATENDTPSVVYAPDKVLSDPFGYKNSGSLDVNFINGEFIFTETDLYIPGINGLDLNITRQYISDFSNASTPYIISTGYHDNEVTMQLVYELYVWDENTETYSLASDFSGYSIVDSTMNVLFKQVLGTYKTTQYFNAVADKAYYTEFAAGQWGGYDDEGNFVIVRLIPSIQPVGNFETAFVPIDINYDYYVDEFGLGHGWRLGFSAIESYLVDLEGSPNGERLILADGRVIDIDENGDLVYELDDLQLVWNGFGYPGAYSTLCYADGKREYFDSNGRNIAIVDRYGNAIKIEYTTVNGESTVTEMKITDTVGNIVVFKDVPVDLGGAAYLQIPGASGSAGQYTSMKTLSLNGEVIRTYYSHEETRTSTSSGHTITIKYITAIKDEAEQHTFYSSSILFTDYNCLVPSSTANDSSFFSNNLNQIQYPNGMGWQIIKSPGQNRSEPLGYSGYQSQSSLYLACCYYGTDSGRQYQNWTNYSIGDFSAQSAPVDEYSYYVCSESSMKYKLYDGGSDRWTSYQTYYTYNYKQQLVKSETIVYTGPTEEEFVQGDISNVSEVGTMSETIFTYDDDLPFPITASTKIYEPGNTTSYMVQNYSYTYDAKGNLLSETLPNDQTITYTYSADYNLPLTTTYKQNADTTIVKQNTLTTDNKSIASTTVTSNGTTVGKTVYTYDAKGRMTALDTYSSATECTTQQLTYGNQAQITQITTGGIKTADGTDAAATPNSAAGTIVEKTSYNTRGWPISYTDGNGNVTSVTYDALGRVTLVSYPDGGTDQYVYDTANNTVTYTDANENIFTYKYDPFGNLIEVYDNTSSQALLSYEYDSRGNKVLETIHSSNSAKDQVTYYKYDYADRLIEVGKQHSVGIKTPLEAYTYNANLGKTTHTVYGSVNVPDSVETVYVDNMGNTIHTGRILEGTEYIDTYTYDYLGNCVEYKSAYTASIGGSYTAKYTYDHAGNLLTTTDALNNTVTNTYDWQGNAIQYQDALGNVTQYTYDKLGRLTKTISPIDSTKDHTVKYYYDPVGNLTEQLTSSGTTAGNFDAVEYTYNSMNRLTEVTTPLNSTTSYSTTYAYDQIGNVLSVRYGNTKVLNSDNTETVTQSPSVTTYTYDRFGKVLTETDALSKTEAYTYDLNGNILTKQDRNGVLTQYTYDSRGRLISEAVGSGSAAITRSYTYAPNGLLLSESQGSDTVTYTYDALGRLTDETSGSMYKTYTYNIGDLRTSFKAGTSLTAPLINNTYTFDALGRLSQVSDGSDSAAYTYNANGNLSATTYGNGLQQVYSYNSGNLVSSVITRKGSTTLEQYQYAYDLAGRQIEYTDTAGTTAYAYDALGQLISEQRVGAQDYTKTYTYDSRGNRTSLTVSDSSDPGSIITLDPAGGQLPEGTSAQIELPVSEDYVLPAPTRQGYFFTGWYLGNIRITGDALSLITGSCTLTAHWATNTGASYFITYNSNGGIGFMAAQVCYENEPVTLRANAFSKPGCSFRGWSLSNDIFGVTVYRPGDTVINLGEPGSTVVLYAQWKAADGIEPPIIRPPDEIMSLPRSGSYSYTTTYTYDAANRLLSSTTGNGTQTYTYDDNGNLLTELNATNTAVVNHSYDALNRLISSTVGNAAITYAYNPQGIRTSRTVGATTTQYLLDGGDVVGETTGGTTTTYLRGLNLVSDGTNYYLHNAHGDVAMLANATGTVTKSYSYDAFGNQLNTNADDTNPFRYCGEYFDSETGNYYLRARYYDPSVGRFTQQDTYRGEITNPRSLNYYAYCYNDPVKYVDKSGHIPFDVILDFASLCWSAVELKNNPSWKNLGYLLWDFGSMLIPYAPGSYAAKGIKMLGKVDDATDIVRGAGRADEAIDSARYIYEIASSSKLRKNMIEAGIEVPVYKNAAHHIVAGSSKYAAEARRILHEFGISINDAVNGVFLPTVKGVSDAAYHPGLHTQVYYDKVNNLLSAANSKEEVIEILSDIADMLQKGTFLE